MVLVQLITKEKGPFDEIEERIPPVLIVQVLDGEATISDDFLGNELGAYLHPFYFHKDLF